ncbi:hypothetical protein HG531_002668 [Fusarium graminearum]|nr:hypothetical protein HG531_002668 [Fusarium graminearum]
MRHGFLHEVLLLLGRQGLELFRLDKLVQLEPADAQLAGELCPRACSVASPLLEGVVHGFLVAVEGFAGCVAFFAGVDEGREHVVAQTLAYAGDVLYDRDVELVELVFGTDSGVHEDAGGVESAG